MRARPLPLLAVLLSAGPAALAAVRAAPVVPRTLTTQFTYTVTLPSPPVGTKALNVWLPVPSESVWQTVSGLKVRAPVPYRITRERKYGDRMVYLHDADPAGPLTATVQFTVKRRAVRVLQPTGPVPKDHSLQPVLAADARVPVGGRFRAIARQVTAGDRTTLQKEQALFHSVVTTMRYDYHHQSPRYAQGDAAFVCDYKAGNCSDLHSYLIALSRSLGIPAELEYGFPLTGIPAPGPLPVDGTIPGYHCWVWFQDSRHAWVPMDAADACRWQDAKRPDVARFLFGDLVLARSAVAMSRGRDIMLVPRQKGKALNDFISPYAEADGTPVDATWTLRYHLPTGGKS